MRTDILDLPAAAKAVGEKFETGVVAACDHGGHEEDFAEMAVALGADGGGVAHAAAALPHAGSDGQPGGGGAAIGEMARNLGAEPACGARADAFDLAEPLEVGVEFGRGLDVAGDLRLDALDFLFQRADQADRKSVV